MAIKHGKRKIQNYLIDKDMQLRIISSTLIFFFGVVILVVSLVLSPLIFDMLISDSMNTQYQAAQNFLVVIKWLIPTVLIISFLIFIQQVIITHRIYGPMFNFSRVFKKVSQGDLSQKVFIRSKDYLHNECNNLNEMIAGLTAIISRIQIGHDNMISVLENHRAQIEETASSETLRTSLGTILSEARSVKNELSVFKFAPDSRETESKFNPKDYPNQSMLQDWNKKERYYKQEKSCSNDPVERSV